MGLGYNILCSSIDELSLEINESKSKVVPFLFERAEEIIEAKSL